MSEDYINEPIGRLFQRVQKGLAVMQGLKKSDPSYNKWLNRYFGIVDHFLSRLYWLETIGMFADEKLMSDKD